MKAFRLSYARQYIFTVCVGILFCLSGCLVPQTEFAPVEFSIDRTSFAYGIFETQATVMTLEVHHDFPASFNGPTDITIDDGTNIVTFEIGNLKPSLIHTMPAGLKRVTVTAGGQIKINGVISGLYVDKIVFYGPAQRIFPTTDRILVYGDSLTLGGDVEFASRQAWPVLLRMEFEVVLDAYGYRMLYDDASTSNDIKKLANYTRSFSPKFIWLAIGTNDYVFAPWSPQDFGSAYRSLVDALHEAVPSAIIFAQSPIRRADENTKVNGYMLDDFREQVEDACPSRLGWCVFVDGRSLLFPQLDELAEDGVHLTAISNIKYTEAILKVIGDR